MASAVHAPPVVMDGLVYAATCSTCGSAAARSVKMGKDGTTAFNARTPAGCAGSNNAGKYASPIIADQERVYLAGRSYLYALEKPKKKKRASSARRIGARTVLLAARPRTAAPRPPPPSSATRGSSC